MLKRRVTAFLSAFGFLLLLSAPAAATTAFVVSDLNLRAGPSTRYPAVTVLPQGSRVEVFGCTEGYAWCDVARRGDRGWVSARYLEFAQQDRRMPVARYAPSFGLPIIAFGFGQYWDDHYYDRPWYGDRRRYAPSRVYRDDLRRDRIEQHYDRRWVDDRRDRRRAVERVRPIEPTQRFIRGGQVVENPQVGPGGVLMGRNPPPIDHGQMP